MYKIAKIIAVGILGFLAIQTYPIKITNNTEHDLLYCCGNPANKNIVLQRYELKPSETIEIQETQNYIQIYTKQKPKALAGKYPLSNQTEDLTIITHPTFGFAFKGTAELMNEEPKKTPPAGAISLYGIAEPKKLLDQHNVVNTVNDRAETQDQTESTAKPAHKATQKNSVLTHLKKDVPLYPGRRPASRIERQNTRQQEPEVDSINSDTPIQNSTHLVAHDNQRIDVRNEIKASTTEVKLKELPLLQKIKARARVIARNKKTVAKPTSTSYFTKKKMAVALGAIGTASLLIWWLRNLKLPVI